MKIAVRFLPVAFPVFLFFLFSFLILNSQLSIVLAAPGDSPNPKPCENAVETDQLTNNWITNENGDPPINQEISRTGSPGQPVDVYLETFFTVDFSKLQSLFGYTNSDYLEGRFQQESHRAENVLELESADFNNFHGVAQKATAKVLSDFEKDQKSNQRKD